MGTVPTSYDQLWQYSVYRQILDVQAGNRSELLRDAYVDGDENSTVEVDINGNLAYYVALPSGGFGRAEGNNGEFLCVRVPLHNADGTARVDDAGNPIMGSKFVHFSQVFQPTETALSRMDLTMVVMGVIYQHAAYTMAMMDNILDAMEELNQRMVVLTRIFSEFTTRQTNLDDKDGAVKVSYQLLESLVAAGVTPPQEWVTTSISPALYIAAYNDYDLGDAFFVRINAFYLEVNGSGDLTPKYVIDNGYYNNMGGSTDSYPVFRDKILKNSYSTGDKRGDIPGAISGLPKLTDEATISAYFAGKKYTYTQMGSGVTEIANIDDAGILRYKNGVWEELVSGGVKLKDTKGEIYSQELGTAYTSNTEPIEDIISAKKSFFANNAQLQSWADVIRTASENLSSTMQTYSTALSLSSNEMQQGFSMGTALIAKLEAA
ncbi:MAG: hypothetical protein LBT98_00495, partial [Puniceicoccales bacterium]|nr:hypothetical protein [Puniceicoccales bacterium]